MFCSQDMSICDNPHILKQSVGVFSSKERNSVLPVPSMWNGNHYSNWEGKHLSDSSHRQALAQELPPPVSSINFIADGFLQSFY